MCFPPSVGANILGFATPPTKNALPRKGHFLAEVLQKSKFRAPRCMRARKKFASHAAWESNFTLLQPPSRDIMFSRNSTAGSRRIPPEVGVARGQAAPPNTRAGGQDDVSYKNSLKPTKELPCGTCTTSRLCESPGPSAGRGPALGTGPGPGRGPACPSPGQAPARRWGCGSGGCG